MTMPSRWSYSCCTITASAPVNFRSWVPSASVHRKVTSVARAISIGTPGIDKHPSSPIARVSDRLTICGLIQATGVGVPSFQPASKTKYARSGQLAGPPTRDRARHTSCRTCQRSAGRSRACAWRRARTQLSAARQARSRCPTRSSARQLAFQLGHFARDHLALHRFEIIDKKLAIQMVDLVLHAGRP